MAASTAEVPPGARGRDTEQGRCYLPGQDFDCPDERGGCSRTMKMLGHDNFLHLSSTSELIRQRAVHRRDDTYGLIERRVGKIRRTFHCPEMSRAFV